MLKKKKGFLGGPVVKNLPTNAWLQSLVQEDCTRAATKPQLLKPVHLEPALCSKSSHCSEKPAHHN